eukprot:5984515-Alexandrium_andersonii.AAC.1
MGSGKRVGGHAGALRARVGAQGQLPCASMDIARALSVPCARHATWSPFHTQQQHHVDASARFLAPILNIRRIAGRAPPSAATVASE